MLDWWSIVLSIFCVSKFITVTGEYTLHESKTSLDTHKAYFPTKFCTIILICWFKNFLSNTYHKQQWSTCLFFPLNLNGFCWFPRVVLITNPKEALTVITVQEVSLVIWSISSLDLQEASLVSKPSTKEFPCEEPTPPWQYSFLSIKNVRRSWTINLKCCVTFWRLDYFGNCGNRCCTKKRPHS